MTNAHILVCIHSEWYDKIILNCYFPKYLLTLYRYKVEITRKLHDSENVEFYK